MAHGKYLGVLFQAEERDPVGMTVRLTVENFGQQRQRWLPPQLTAFSSQARDYIVVDADHDKNGHAILQDIYPGEQFTFCYRFTFPPGVSGAKHLATLGCDDAMTFSWYSGV
jgi:hypothetical protein